MQVEVVDALQRSWSVGLHHIQRVEAQGVLQALRHVPGDTHGLAQRSIVNFPQVGAVSLGDHKDVAFGQGIDVHEGQGCGILEDFERRD